MSFEDIDTPAPESELSGQAAADPVDTLYADPLDADPAPEIVEAPAEDPAPERNPVIPRARFDEVNAKLHAERERAEAAERELAEFRQAQQGAQSAQDTGVVDVKALIKASKEAMMEGDTDRAAEIDFQIYQEQQRSVRVEAEATFAQQRAASEAQSEMQSTFNRSIEVYPFLDHRADDHNAEAIADVLEWRSFYAAKGIPDHVALEKAVAKVGPLYATAAPAAQTVDGRKQAALARNAADAAAQPPANVSGMGNRAAPSSPKVETQSDWEKLNESDRESMLQ